MSRSRPLSMSLTLLSLVLTSLVLTFSSSVLAQESRAGMSPDEPSASGRADIPGKSVPRLVRFTGTLRDGSGQALSGAQLVTFALYAEQAGTTPLWTESQTVVADEAGRYAVMLGASLRGGIPIAMFATGEARWLETRRAGDAAAAQRLMLVSVPFALKAEDAEKLGGRSASEFVLTSELEQQVTKAVSEQQAKMKPSAAKNSGQAFYAPDKPISTTVQDIAPNGAARFSDTSLVEVVLVQQSGTGFGLNVISINGSAIKAQSLGVGSGNATILAQATSTTGAPVGLQGESFGQTGIGVQGIATSPAATSNVGVRGEAAGSAGRGVVGMATNGSGPTVGVLGSATSSTGVGVRGEANSASGGTGALGIAGATSGNSIGVQGEVSSATGTAGLFRSNNSGGKVLVGQGPGVTDVFTVDAGGNVTAEGTLTATGGLTTTGPVSVGGVNVPSANSASGVLKATNSGAGAAVEGIAAGTTNAGVYGRSVGSSGVGVRGEANSASGVAGVFNNTASGKILSGQDDGNEVFNVMGSGDQIVAATQAAGAITFPLGTPQTVPSAIFGYANSIATVGAGVVGVTDTSISGAGVVGVATNVTSVPDNSPFGVAGVSFSDNGGGVYATAASATGATTGITAEVQSPAGIAGVFTNNAAGQLLSGNNGSVEVFSVDGTGTVTGLAGIFTGPAGGVLGRDTINDGGVRRGVIGITASTGGQAIFGNATATTASNNIGVFGQAAGDNGAGVFGRATSATGTTSGVRGINFSAGGHGVRGDSYAPTTNAVTTGGIGVLGGYGQNSNGTTNPNATGGVGVRGRNFAVNGYGVNGEAFADNGVGVEGVASGTNSGRGVRGNLFSLAGFGVEGVAQNASGTGIGVNGVTNSSNGAGVRAEATPTTGAAVAFTAINNGPAVTANFFALNTGKILSGNNIGGEVFSVNNSGAVTSAGLIRSTSGGFQFPDNTIQTTAATGGSGAQTGVANTWTASQTFNADTIFGANVGIGTPAPGHALDIVGNARVSGNYLLGGFPSKPYTRFGLDAFGLFIEQAGSTTANDQIRLQSSAGGDTANYTHIVVDPGVGAYIGRSGSGTKTSLGVNTSTPQAQLDVRADTASTKGMLVRGAASQSASLFEWQNSSGTTLGVISGAGNVGIGTATPATPLHVSTSSLVAERLESTHSAGVATEYRSTTAGASVDWFVQATAAGANQGPNKLVFGSTSIVNPGVLTLDGLSGSVGIGTSTPSAKLDVVGNILTSGTITSAGLIHSTSGGIKFPDNTIQTTAASGGSGAQTGVANTWTAIQTFNADTIFGANVGIGTAAPGEKLVLSDGDGSIRFRPSNPAIFSVCPTCSFGPGAGHLYLNGGDGPQQGGNILLGGQQRGDANINGIIFNQGLTERMRIHNGGNVGIGTATPGSALQVVGTVTATSFLGDGSGLTGLSGAQTSTANTFSSSQTFNSDVVLGTSAAQILNNTSGGHFLRSTASETNQWIFEEASPKWGLYFCNNNSLCTGNGLSGADYLFTKNADEPNASAGFSLNGLPGITANTNASIRLSALDGGAYFAGKVGFGTPTPEAPLLAEFRKDLAAGLGPIVAITNKGGGQPGPAGQKAAIHFGVDSSDVTSSLPNVELAAINSGNSNASDFTIAAFDGSVFAEVLRVQGQTHRVGIGTSAPSQTLDVVGNGNFSGTVTATSFSGSGAALTGIVASSASALALPITTNSTTGVITSNGSSFIHSFGNENTFIGKAAGNFTMAGNGNTAIGAAALQDNDGGLNTAIGLYALRSNTTGNDNSATGAYALWLNTIGYRNTASGSYALYANTTGDSNTATGYAALQLNGIGRFNTASGIYALYSNTEGNENTATGVQALNNNMTGNYNSAMGMYALTFNTTGNNNTALGYKAGHTAVFGNGNTTGSSNTFLGYNSGPGTPTQLTNATAIGANALVTASNAMILGDSAVSVGIGTTTPSQKLHVVGNILASGAVTATSFSGDGSGLTGLSGAQTGSANTFTQPQTMPVLVLPNTTSATNGVITFGTSIFIHNFGTENTFIGRNAGNFTMFGSSNTASGFNALPFNTTGNENTATGTHALYSNTTGERNSATGSVALFGNTSGQRNSATGYAALTDNTTGNNNTALGYLAGRTAIQANANTTGSDNTFIGYNSGPGTPTQLTNATAIGANAIVGQSNAVVLGSGADVGIGTSTPTAKLDVVGDIKASGAVTIGGGQPIAKHLSASGAISFVAVPGGGCSSVPTVAVSGAAVGDSVSIGINGPLAGASLFMYMGYVSAPGVVTIRACNHDTVSASVSGTVKVNVWQ